MSGLRPDLVIMDDIVDADGSQSTRTIYIAADFGRDDAACLAIMERLANGDMLVIDSISAMVDAEMEMGLIDRFRMITSPNLPAIHYERTREAQWKQETRGRPPQHNSRKFHR